jgi:hypothetical protein
MSQAAEPSRNLFEALLRPAVLTVGADVKEAPPDPEAQEVLTDMSLRVELADATHEQELCELLAEKHYLGADRPVGDHLRQVVTRAGRLVAILTWGPACYALKDRDLWIGWCATQRVERLSLLVQNRRFLLLTERGESPNLASQVLAAAVRALPGHWLERFGYRPLLAETFTDPESYQGTCYKASAWEPVGTSQGYERHRADFYREHGKPKRLWLRPLHPSAKKLLRAENPALPEDCRAGLRRAPTGTLPLKAAQLPSLLEALREVPDPRSKNTRFKIGPVLAIVALALLAGRRDIASIARMANLLDQDQRFVLCLPREAGKKIRSVPGYSVFYEVLTRLDPEAFAHALNRWLCAQAGALPAALALDAKFIRDAVGVLSLVEADTGAPVALAVVDQKEATPRSEQARAPGLLASVPLDERIVTGDALHATREQARVIVEKGGEYLLQIKGNQPQLSALVERARSAPPFFLS